MGNKQSSEGGRPGQRSSDPTSRSFSWQPDPLFAPGVHSFPDIQPVPFPPPKRYGSMNVLSEQNIPQGNPNPYQDTRSPHSPKQNFRPHSMSNGSVIIDEAVFGGVKPMPQFGMKGTPKRSPDGGDRSQREEQQWKRSENSESPAKGSRPGTSDSGYLTGMDSDAKMRSRLRGSRLSLNEAIFDTHHQQHSVPSPSPGSSNFRGPPMGPHGPYPPHMFPPPHFGGPMQMRPPPEAYMMGPYPADSKKGKKWRKKKKSKMEKWNSRSESMPPFRNECGEPMMPGYGHGMGPGRRAQSVDNFGDLGLLPPGVGPRPFFPPPPPPELAKRFSSQMDLSGMPPPWMRGGPAPFPGPPPSQFTPEPHAPKRKGKGARSPNKSAPGSEKQSISSGRGSKREKEATHFEEERLDIQDMAPLETPSNQRSGSESRNATPSIQYGIYESLRGQQHISHGSAGQSERTSIVATVEVSQNVPDPEEERNEPVKRRNDRKKCDAQETIRIEELPLKISAEAQAVFERNEKLLGYVEKTKDTAEPSPQFDAIKEPRREDKKIGKMETRIENPQVIDASGELELVPVHNPILLPRKKTKQKDFEPLEAWRGINVERAVRERQPHRDTANSIPIVDEKISVRLTPVLPSRTETQGEPIYSEYDERLPEFKKRLIETGSFDFPGKFRHQSSNGGALDSPASGSPAVNRRKLSRDEMPSQPVKFRDLPGEKRVNEHFSGEESAQRSEERPTGEKGSLRRLKDSVSGMFHHRSKSTELEDDLHIKASPLAKKRASGNVQDFQQYQSTGSLAPSNANTTGTRGGESSEIDFSWVHDLETKFRMDEFSGGGIGTGTGKENNRDVSLDASIRKSFESNFGGMISQQEIPAPNVTRDHCASAVASTSQEGARFPQNGTRYFGMTGQRPTSTATTGLIGSSSYEVSHMTKAARESELNQLETNVRLKAALFEQEAAKLQTVEENRHEKNSGHGNNRTPNTSRKVENDHRYPIETGLVRASYDYGADRSYNNDSRDYESPIAKIAANVQTTLDQRPKYVEGDSGESSNNSFRSPSERKIHRLEQQRREGWVNGLSAIQQQQQQRANYSSNQQIHDGRMDPGESRTLVPPSPAAQFSQESRLAAYHLNGRPNTDSNGHADPEAQLQKNRVYNATEFYRHNYQEDRNNRGAERWSMQQANGQFPYASQPALYHANGNGRPYGAPSAFPNGAHYKSSEWY